MSTFEDNYGSATTAADDTASGNAVATGTSNTDRRSLEPDGNTTAAADSQPASTSQPHGQTQQFDSQMVTGADFQTSEYPWQQTHPNTVGQLGGGGAQQFDMPAQQRQFEGQQEHAQVEGWQQGAMEGTYHGGPRESGLADGRLGGVGTQPMSVSASGSSVHLPDYSQQQQLFSQYQQQQQPFPQQQQQQQQQPISQQQ